jgi:hypothetical protein
VVGIVGTLLLADIVYLTRSSVLEHPPSREASKQGVARSKQQDDELRLVWRYTEDIAHPQAYILVRHTWDAAEGGGFIRHTVLLYDKEDAMCPIILQMCGVRMRCLGRKGYAEEIVVVHEDVPDVQLLAMIKTKPQS